MTLVYCISMNIEDDNSYFDYFNDDELFSNKFTCDKCIMILRYE